MKGNVDESHGHDLRATENGSYNPVDRNSKCIFYLTKGKNVPGHHRKMSI